MSFPFRLLILLCFSWNAAMGTEVEEVTGDYVACFKDEGQRTHNTFYRFDESGTGESFVKGKKDRSISAPRPFFWKIETGNILVFDRQEKPSVIFHRKDNRLVSSGQDTLLFLEKEKESSQEKMYRPVPNGSVVYRSTYKISGSAAERILALAPGKVKNVSENKKDLTDLFELMGVLTTTPGKTTESAMLDREKGLLTLVTRPETTNLFEVLIEKIFHIVASKPNDHFLLLNKSLVDAPK